jgi:CDP-glucose 4,6-dehydratase
MYARKLMKETYWQDRPVFITGCTGLLGSWLTQSLIERGADIVGLIRDNTPNSFFFQSGFEKSITTVRGEIEDYALVERLINEYEIESVFHLGAQTIVTISNRSPLATFRSNIQGTWNILEACRQISTVKRIVVASSDKAYGDQKNLPYNENTPLEGRHPYDVSKSCADLICRSYFETYNLPVCVTRCGNLYGAGDLNFNRIVPGTIRSLFRGERPVIRSNGTFLRDYFYVSDAVNAYVYLAEKMDEKKIHGEAFNFSTESPQTVLEVVKTISALMGSSLEPVILNTAINEIADQYLSAKKARNLLKWSAGCTLEEGLKETIPWYQKYFRKPT